MAADTVVLFDYSQGRPSAEEIKAAGGDGVMRYLWFEGSNRQDLTHEELWGLLDGGIGVGLIWETSAARPLGGYSAGVFDANLVEVQLVALGVVGAPVWFAVDFDVTGDGQLTAVGAYFQGVLDGLGHVARVKVYGEHKVCEWLQGRGLASGYWQTTAWSKGEWSTDFHMIQRVGTVQVGGVDADVNEWNFERYPDFDGILSQEGTADVKLTPEDVKAIAAEVLFNTELQNAEGGTGYNLNTTVYWTNVYANDVPAVQLELRALKALVIEFVAAGTLDPQEAKRVITEAFRAAAQDMINALDDARAADPGTARGIVNYGPSPAPVSEAVVELPKL